MGIFGFIDDMKEKAEKRKRAAEYRRKARQYIEDGERIYNTAYSEVFSYSYETSKKIEKHYDYKQQIIKELKSDVAPVITRFNDFDIDRKVIDSPSVNASVLSSISGMDLCKSLSSSDHSVYSVFPIPRLDELFSDPDEEYWEARRQKDEANRFYENMKYERNNLHNIKEKMRTIRYYIDDEKELLAGLTSKVKNISAQLNTSMKRKRFSQSEADYLKGVHEIAQSLSELLTTKFFDNNFNITSQYKTAFEKIKAIDNSLPTAPTISQGTEVLRKLLEIFDKPLRT